MAEVSIIAADAKGWSSMELTIQMFLIVCPLVFLAGLIDSIRIGFTVYKNTDWVRLRPKTASDYFAGICNEYKCIGVHLLDVLS